MHILQLKPHQESFYKVIHDKIKGLDAIVLCEGASDTEVAKKILRKIEKKLPKTDKQPVIAFTDAEGKENIPLLASALLLLSKLSRKLKAIVVIIDADEDTAEKRTRSLVDSILSRKGDLQLKLSGTKRDNTSSQVFMSNIHVNGRKIRLIIAVNGDPGLCLTKHTLEDHCINLMELSVPKGATNAKQIVNDIALCLDKIDKTDPQTICKSFTHICRALELLYTETT
uniref:Uncharacterized protein n=1 Tax=Thermofilum adornatum TaxID=1365176 RepID=A0A7C1GA58_9CREN